MKDIDERNTKKYKKSINKKSLIIVFIVIISIVLLSSTFGRYAINAINDFYLRSKEFYFNSDKMSVNKSLFRVDNWSGVDDYTITINMNSRNNNIQVGSYDIDYDITYSCSDNAICTLSKTKGTISSSTNSDYFNIKITPNKQLVQGDKVDVLVTASTTAPYKKTIKGEFVLTVGKEALTYQIVDSASSPYLELDITNTLSYYIVSTAFDSYKVGDKITGDTYLALSADNKKKCYSAEITLSFDPNVIVLDMINTNYLNALNVTNTKKNNYNYINGLTFRVEALSSTKVRFYKTDIKQNYTYPNTSGTSSIVT